MILTRTLMQSTNPSQVSRFMCTDLCMCLVAYSFITCNSYTHQHSQDTRLFEHLMVPLLPFHNYTHILLPFQPPLQPLANH